MPERPDDQAARRRTLDDGPGPVLPPPPADLDAEKRRAEEARAAKQAERDQARRDREVRAGERRAAKQERSVQKAREAEEKARDAERAERARATSVSATRTPSGRAGSSTAAGPTHAAGGSGTKARPRNRRAQLRLVQVDAWSVMKTSFLLSIAIGIVLVVAVAIIWSVLGAAGVWDSINSVVQQSVGSQSGPQFDITDYVGTSRVMGITLVIAAVDVVLITAIATLGAFLYNLSAALLGGIEVTLAEDN